MQSFDLIPPTPKLAPNPTRAPEFSISIRSQTLGELQCADPRSTRALIAVMDMCAVLGGAAAHWGGPAAFAELNSALFAVTFALAKKQQKPWHEILHLINDAGHCENGLYALRANYGFAGLRLEDLMEFRSLNSKLTGHGESHLFPEAIELSNGPLASAVAQAQGLAMADARAGNKRTTVLTISDGACMEGEAREAFASIPGLAKHGKVNPFLMIVSDNNTKLSGRIDADSFSMQPTLQSLQTLGWQVVHLDGHDLEKCVHAIEAALAQLATQPQTPICIHAKTVKGFGVRKTMDSSSGGHGFPLKKMSELLPFVEEIYAGESLPAAMQELLNKASLRKPAASRLQPFGKEDKIQVGVSAALIEARRKGLPVISVTSDLPGSTGVAGFRKEFPADSFDVGVAEANMISVAAGFSRTGFIPVVDTFAQFGVTKGALPLTMASLSSAPMICIFSHTGFQDAADGASHQALSYLAMTGSIPGVRVYALSCSTEAEALISQCVQKFANDRKMGKTPDTSIFFLGRENFPIQLVDGFNYKLDASQVLHSPISAKKTITIVASGSLVVEALDAANKLVEQGIECFVINPSCHNHIDFAPIAECLQQSEGRLLIAEDHQLIGGLNQAIGFEIAKHGLQVQVKSLAVRGEFGQSAYNAWDLYRKHRLDSQAIVEAGQTFFAGL